MQNYYLERDNLSFFSLSSAILDYQYPDQDCILSISDDLSCQKRNGFQDCQKHQTYHIGVIFQLRYLVRRTPRLKYPVVKKASKDSRFSMYL